MHARDIIDSITEGGEFPRKHAERSLRVRLKDGQMQTGSDGKESTYKTLKAAREAAKSAGGRVSGWNYRKGRFVDL